MSIFGDFFKSDIESVDQRNPQAVEADKFLASQLNRDPADFPRRQVAGLSENEQLAGGIAKNFGTSKPEGTEVLRGVANQSANILEDPSIKALLEELQGHGELESNRLARGLMIRGQTGGVSADALGRGQADIQRNTLAALAPYASQRTSQRVSAADTLSRLGDSSTLSRINALSVTGGLERQIEDMQNEADYQRYVQQIEFPANIASGLSRSTPQQLVSQPSDFETFTNLAKPAAGAYLGGTGQLGIS